MSKVLVMSQLILMHNHHLDPGLKINSISQSEINKQLRKLAGVSYELRRKKNTIQMGFG